MRWLFLAVVLTGCAGAHGAGRYARPETSWLRQGHDFSGCGGGLNFVNQAVDRCMQAKGYRVVE